MKKRWHTRWDQHRRKLIRAEAKKDGTVEITVKIPIPPEKIVPVKKWGDSEHDTVVHSTNTPHVGRPEYDQKYHAYRVSGG